MTLITNQNGDVLTVQTTYRSKPTLPGGAAHQDEKLADAATRELAEETGLRRRLAQILAVDQTPPNARTGATEGLNVVFDGGTLTPEEEAALSIPAKAHAEIEALVWVAPTDLDEKCDPYQARRIKHALAAREFDQALPALFRGELAA
ncbi:NUDIX hydrolase [Streptomyces tateyamensis]|uniref:NUDIX hydrolase n=2 Tax=Streptomyces tateyamensis TaxID=565073 RepID=A0A2V4P2Y3_9ACTN|nr:NUDIX hydrolase [Streptomyces tateyamensis]